MIYLSFSTSVHASRPTSSPYYKLTHDGSVADRARQLRIPLDTGRLGLVTPVADQGQEVVAERLHAPLLLGVLGTRVLEHAVPVVQPVGGLIVNLLHQDRVHVRNHAMGQVDRKVLLRKTRR